MRLTEKNYHYLIHLFDTPTTYDVHEYIQNSTIDVEKDFRSSFADAYQFKILTDPEIYKKYQGYINIFNKTITHKFREFSGVLITNAETQPDLRKFLVLRNQIVPIHTPWEAINNDQLALLANLRSSNVTVDFQNIGNSSRTLLQKLANTVFDPLKHIPLIANIDLSEGKFKNRLHTYIKCELGGNQNKEIRGFAESIIDTAESSIDLSNNLTHDLKANSLLAEFCVISTITCINIVKLIFKKE